MATKIKITKTKSDIGSSQRQKDTLKALGLGRMLSSTVKENSDCIRGMVNKVSHLVSVEEVEA
ncbi:50S ribosomal protein L30 [Chitinivibrio alkaliphilus]|uniref:50S ribosomal protein L30 n=1 Tax=Chitinivibrio alkaliphilus ACht1 TaxID=1313304 RepID=U7D6W2_9BACT|nr:50S ribosomal protein L30 [Chitinivibrio alkaliphilus]ERP31306.1 50S ribosomal protein L30 [Chitinivibrio alkaliphilus ACht1]